MMHRRLFLLSSLCFLGCSGSDEPRRHALSGTVVVEGTAVAAGTISFLPSPGNSAQPAHTSIKDGKYRFQQDNGPYSGAHRVVIGIKSIADKEPNPETGGEEFAGQGIKEAAAPRRQANDQRAPVSTKLQWEVEYTVPEDGDDKKDFELGG